MMEAQLTLAVLRKLGRILVDDVLEGGPFLFFVGLFSQCHSWVPPDLM